MKKIALLVALLVAPSAMAEGYWDDLPDFVQTISLDGTNATNTTVQKGGYYAIQCTAAFYLKSGTGATAANAKAYAARPDGTAFVRMVGANNSISLFAAAAATCYLFRHGN